MRHGWTISIITLILIVLGSMKYCTTPFKINCSPDEPKQVCDYGHSTLTEVKEICDRNRSLVILTACDEACLRISLSSFLGRGKVNEGSTVVIALDMPGNAYCKSLTRHSHHCSLELISCIQGLHCPLKHEEIMTFLSPGYRAALLLKVNILQRVIAQFDLSVLWVDLDVIFLFQDPVPALLKYSEGADMLIASEQWRKESWFPSDVKRLESVASTKIDLLDRFYYRWLKATTYRGKRLEVNGGLIFIKATEGSRLLMARWANQMHEEYIVQQRITSGSCSLDQTVIEEVFTTWHLTKPVTKVHPTVHVLSGQIAISKCWTGWPCLGFDHQRNANGSVTCFMPQSVLDRAILFHANCASLSEKTAMINAQSLQVIDEDGFWKDHNRVKRARCSGLLHW